MTELKEKLDARLSNQPLENIKLIKHKTGVNIQFITQDDKKSKRFNKRE